jgi:hypothetical protein
MKPQIRRSVFVVAMLTASAVLTGALLAQAQSLPAKYNAVMDKRWVVTKCLYNAKDMTKEYYKNNSGGDPVFYIFKNDGSVETNLKGLKQVTWSWDTANNLFLITAIEEQGPGTTKYTIEKITDKDFQLDIKMAKLSLIMQAK